MSACAARQTVLVVEDEALVRMYAVDVLEDAGYEVVEACDAQRALAQVAARPDISVMFTDINMPGAMDGFDLAREVNRIRPDVHLILTSGKMTADRMKHPEILAFVPKPYTAENLTGLLSQVFS